MRRTLTVIGMAGALAVGQAVLAGPAGAENNCSVEDGLVVCHGGTGFGGGDGGFGGRSVFDPATFESVTSGGGSLSQGGFGQRCTVSGLGEAPVCVGGNS